MPLTLAQLEYALAVNQHRHFGRAARACSVSQPTLSQQLSKLEDDAGVILFERSRQPILPTPEGERFLAQAAVVLKEYEKLLHVSKQPRDGTLAGEFRLGVIPTVASDLLPFFLNAFSTRHPAVTLAIEELKTETILEELSADRLDGAILATPVEGSDDLTVHPLYYEPFFAYFSARHPLLKKTSVTRADLDPSEIWLLQDGHCFKNQVLDYCARPGRAESGHRNVRFRSGSLDTLRKLVRANPGYTLLPALMAQSLRREEREAHVRPLRSPAPAREISLVYRRGHWKLDLLRAIEATIEEKLPPEVSRKPLTAQSVIEVR